MPLPPSKQAGDRDLMRPSGRGSYDDDDPSNTLWVGNLPPDTVDSEMMALFGKYGVLDSLTTYSARNYAFVNFKYLDDAKIAKEALQGSLVRGHPIKIEFARPARPGKNLWVGGVCPSVSKEQLESEFSRFGKIEELKFLRDRNSALVSFFNVDDAVSALKNMNGKRLGGEQLRVDYLRSQPSRRDWLDHHDPRDPAWMPPESTSNFPRIPPPIARRDIQSKILWIGYPPSVQIDEQMLHNAMILFGEIEQIRCFPSKHYSIVEFRSVDEARRAKEGLQGRLFNDPRIQILFSTGGDFVFPGDGGFFSRQPPQRPDFFPEQHHPPRPPFGHVGPIGGFPRGLMHGGMGSLDLPPPPPPPPPPPEFFRSLSPPVFFSGAPPAGRPPPGVWDGMDAREAKRMRMDGPVDEAPALAGSRMAGGEGVMRDGGYGGPGRRNPVLGRRPEHIWRGVIAKGGTAVCGARCVPVGKGIESPFPEMVNCSAKTGLDTLAKHYADAAGVDVVFFLPDSEEDFGSYTEFLQYLGQHNRAGVAKLDDGATMFLVPPSDFLTDVLNLSGPKRLYGIVLRMPPRPPSPPPAPPQSLPAGKPAASPPVDMALTPELIATLAALVPAPAQASPAAAVSSAENGRPAAPQSLARAAHLPSYPGPQGPVQEGGGGAAARLAGRPLGGYAAVQGNQQKLQEMSALQSRPSGAAQAQHQAVAEKGSVGLPSQKTAGGEAETEAEKNQRYQSTLQFAASLLLQIQQQQAAKGAGNQ